MRRRSFLLQCGLAAAGTVFLPAFVPATGGLRAAGANSALSAAQLTPSDRALLGLLSAYGSDAYFWGNSVLTRATGIETQGTVNLLVRVANYDALVAFFRSTPFKTLGRVRSQDNTLSFSFGGTAYTVTNAGAADFNRAVAGGGVSLDRNGEIGLGVLSSQTLLYHPATDALTDPNLVLTSRKVDLVVAPTGGIKARVQTLVDGWLESRRHGLKLGKKFTKFQADLLGSVPTDKAAKKVVRVLLSNISDLAAVFSIDDLRPLVTSPLISASLQSELGLDADEALDKLETLRAELASSDYPDAALWLLTLLKTQIQDGTVGDWLDLLTDDSHTNAANAAALSGARKLVSKTADDAQIK